MVGGKYDLPPIPSNDAYDKDPEVWDLIIVGCGVAGSALSFRQGKEGRRILVIERDLTQPDRIVGELLQPGGFLKLKDLGLEEAVNGIDSQKVYGYAMFKNGKVASVKYPVEGFKDEVAGRSFHHGRFIQKLRTQVAQVPTVALRQGTVKRLLGADGKEWEEGTPIGGVQYRTSDDTDRVARAHLTIVCDGLNSNLRKNFIDPKISYPSYFVGIILDQAKLPFPNFGHVVLADPSPILFYPISSTETRCLVDIPGTKIPSVSTGDMAKYLMDVVYPQVPPELQPAFKRAVEGGASIRSMQNKCMYSQPYCTPGGLLLGDAFNMRHPLTGGGMTVALSDTKLLCELLEPLKDLTDPIATTKQTTSFHVRRKPLSATINTLANALYRVFSQNKESAAHEEMRQACFDYLRLGGIYSQGPVSLLSGLNPRPSVLVMHFFMVAIFGVGRLLYPLPTPHKIKMSVMLIATACSIILPIIRAEGPIAVFLPALASKPRVPNSAQANGAGRTKAE